MTEKTVKCYTCECGENIFEDDTECVNCGKSVDQSLLKEEPLVEIHEVLPEEKEEKENPFKWNHRKGRPVDMEKLKEAARRIDEAEEAPKNN